MYAKSLPPNYAHSRTGAFRVQVAILNRTAVHMILMPIISLWRVTEDASDCASL